MLGISLYYIFYICVWLEIFKINGQFFSAGFRDTVVDFCTITLQGFLPDTKHTKHQLPNYLTFNAQGGYAYLQYTMKL